MNSLKLIPLHLTIRCCSMSTVSGIRLTDGGSPNQGRVEVSVNGMWGSVCSNGWDIKEAEVVCRILNFTSATSAPTAVTFRGGTGPIWLNDVSCYGNESSISECRHKGLGRHSCYHNRDAGVICGPVSGKHAFEVTVTSFTLEVNRRPIT